MGKSTVYVAWREESLGEDDIFFARSIDGGKSFGNTINLSNNAGSSANPRLAVASNGNNVYADGMIEPLNQDQKMSSSEEVLMVELALRILLT